jgi:hypothetical protein
MTRELLTRELLTPSSALAASFPLFDRWWADARCNPDFTQHGWDESGSTAVIGMVSEDQLVVANAGGCTATLLGVCSNAVVQHCCRALLMQNMLAVKHPRL